jgi:4-amino-4-deoxy-L-arabinose transferase-like glycosyltransferase
MQEPSVLDYLKSKLSPWSRETLALPAQDEEPSNQTDGPTLAESASPVVSHPVPWRPILAVGFAILGQSFLESPAAQPVPALAFYFVALLLLAWTVLRGEWKMPDLRYSDPAEDSGVFRPVSFALACAFALVAFTLFGENSIFDLFVFGESQFNGFNTLAWGLSIAFFVHSLWLPRFSWRERWQQAREFFTRGSWVIQVTPWLLLLILIWSLAAFYRFSNLVNVPPEPFSDHAEKLLDVRDLSQGETKTFFDRNTGREFFQMYLTLAVATVFGTGLSFLSLKLGTALAGFFTLPYVYLLGKELFNKRVGLLALAFTAIAYWPNVISRVGLRFPLYPLFAAPALYYLLRGLRTNNRNDFILSGLFIGLGLHGYSSFRFVPIFVVVILLLYLLHHWRSALIRQQVIIFSVVLTLAAFLVFLPLLRYTLDRPDMVAYRALTRLSSAEVPLPGEPLVIFFDNLKNAMLMFNVDNGQIWVHSVAGRPALDVVSAAFFIFGFLLLVLRYLRHRDWRDLVLVLSIPMLLMPSVLSLAFPLENPSLNRTSGAYITAFIIVAFALDALYKSLADIGWRKSALALLAFLFAVSAFQNYDLVFEKYYSRFRYSIWNTSDIANVANAFHTAGNPLENAWVVAYPHWVDTRLVGVMLGDPTYDPVLWPDQIGDTLYYPGNKIFFVKQNDFESLELLRAVYPTGSLSYYRAAPDLTGKDFWVFSVPDTLVMPEINFPSP